MKYFKEGINQEVIERITGAKIKRFSKGNIRTGHIVTDEIDGKLIEEPERKEGIEIEFEKELTVSQLAKLNKNLPGYKRDYTTIPFIPGEKRDLEAEIDELKIKVNKLQTAKGGML